ncbi:MAG: hypothetical protein KBC36_00860 [Spirochaetia bacterium]|nr:hypothetical protein [Spirochaetia bacterium]
MPDYEHEQSEDELRHLEDEHAGSAHEEREDESRAPKDRSGKSLPEPLYRVQLEHARETFYAWREEPEPLEPGALVVLQTRYGKDICKVLGIVRNPGYLAPDDVVKIDRLAGSADLERREQNRPKEEHAFEVCRKKIETHRLSMKLVSAHYVLDEPKILFFFAAESRVDFRELVKDLVGVFRTRIELRQIGVRDEARVTGGCGVCGRALCCHGVSDKLNPVSIKMAKDQNLSLNSMKISGPCGRLLCCLAYEYGFYREERRRIPSEGARFTYDGTLFRVVEINVPAGRIRLHGEDGRTLTVESSRFQHVDGRWTLKDEEASKQDV